MADPAPTILQQQHDDHAETRIGVLYGICAYTWWGLAPIYFKFATAIASPLEILAHRIIWSLVLLTLLIALKRDLKAVLSALTTRRVALTLACSTLLVAGNWLIFIWSVATGRVSQAGLGYFITPLMSVFLGFLFLKERLRRPQKIAVLLALIGVAYKTWTGGQIPAVALTLAVTFSLYGLLRKTCRVGALAGLAVETAFLLPVAIVYLAYCIANSTAAFGTGSIANDALLAAAGIITAVPLLWFVGAARRLRLATLGFLQYIAPTGQLSLAIFIYHETFSLNDLICFSFIWIALGIYSFDAARNAPRNPVVASGFSKKAATGLAQQN